MTAGKYGPGGMRVECATRCAPSGASVKSLVPLRGDQPSASLRNEPGLIRVMGGGLNRS